MGRWKHFTGQSFWARGYYVSTVGRDEETVRNYIKLLKGSSFTRTTF
jgi:putative transposase